MRKFLKSKSFILIKKISVEEAMVVPAKELSVLRTVYSTSAEFDPGIANNYLPTIAPPFGRLCPKKKQAFVEEPSQG